MSSGAAPKKMKSACGRAICTTYVLFVSLFSVYLIPCEVLALSSGAIRKNRFQTKLYSNNNDVPLSSSPRKSSLPHNRIDRRAALTRIIVPPALVGLGVFPPKPTLAKDGIIIVRLPSPSVPSGLEFALHESSVVIKSASISSGIAYSQEARPGMIVLGYNDVDSLMKKLESGPYPMELRLFDPNYDPDAEKVSSNSTQAGEAPVEENQKSDEAPQIPVEEAASVQSKPEPEPQSKPEPKAELKSEPKSKPAPEPQQVAELKPESKPVLEPQSLKTDTETEQIVAAHTKIKEDSKTEMNVDSEIASPLLNFFSGKHKFQKITFTAGAIATLAAALKPKAEYSIDDIWPSSVPESEKPYRPKSERSPPPEPDDSLSEPLETSANPMESPPEAIGTLSEPVESFLNPEEYSPEIADSSVEPIDVDSNSEPIIGSEVVDSLLEPINGSESEAIESLPEYINGEEFDESSPEPEIVEDTSTSSQPATTYEEYMKQRQDRGMF